jgi:hypothetical protein
MIEVIDGLADFLQTRVECLAVGVVGFIGKNRKMRQAGNGLQTQIGDFGAGFVLLCRVEQQTAQI